MAKKTKSGTASAKDSASKVADPVKTGNLVRLLNTLALLLAIAAFLLQLFAVLSHHWKWQITDLRSLLSSNYGNSRSNVYEDSRLDQNYGLYSRDVKVYANNDEQLDVWSSTRFPRPDDGEETLDRCLSQTSSLRGAFLTCSKQLVSPDNCHCRRYRYWNFVIFFEVTALILLGIVVFLLALLRTQFQAILKLAGAGLALLAFIFLLIGLILILSHLKRETRSLGDAYPHIYQRLASKLGIVSDQNRAQQRNFSPLRRAVRRQSSDIIRAYPLLPGQHPYNDTHFQEYSEQARAWVYRPYASISGSGLYAPRSQDRQNAYVAVSRRNTTAAPLYSRYGPAVGYDQVFDKTRAGIGWSTILSILATILSFLLPLILIFSWLTGKKLGPDTTKTVTTTTYKQEYVAVPTTIPHEAVTTRPIPTDYSPQRPVAEAIVSTRNPQQSSPYDAHAARSEPVIVRDVIIRDDQPGALYTQERSGPNTMESSQTGYRN